MNRAFNKYGLKGSSGLGKEYGLSEQILHISANYGINNDNEVFVKCFFDGGFNNYNNKETEVFYCESWSRMDKKEAIQDHFEIIKCCKCDSPAVSLDHHWPYYSDHNLCKKHFENRK